MRADKDEEFLRFFVFVFLIFFLYEVFFQIFPDSRSMLDGITGACAVWQ